jgi:hypothetical protein
MKHVFVLCCLFAVVSCNDAPSAGQPAIRKDSTIIKKEAANPYVQVDVSPMDMAYFPADYPIQKMNEGTTKPPVMRVIYSRPHRGGRKLFGELVKWGQPWRLGANEATEIQFLQPVIIQNKKVEKGQYLLYAIPYQDKWTIVLNSNLYSWGLKFNPSKDVITFDVPSVNKPQLIEYFTMIFDKTATGADLLMAWENTEVRLPIQF